MPKGRESGHAPAPTARKLVQRYDIPATRQTIFSKTALFPYSSKPKRRQKARIVHICASFLSLWPAASSAVGFPRSPCIGRAADRGIRRGERLKTAEEKTKTAGKKTKKLGARAHFFHKNAGFTWQMTNFADVFPFRASRPRHGTRGGRGRKRTCGTDAGEVHCGGDDAR